MHERQKLLDALERALVDAGVTIVPAVDAVQEEDLPCVVIEEREEQMREFDAAISRPATALRRRLRVAIFAFGHTRVERDDLARTVEERAVPAAWGVNFKTALVGVGFSRTRVGTSAAAFAAGQFYDAEYMTPTYAPASQ